MIGPGQYQIGNLVIGRNTNYPVDTFEEAGYGMSTADYQLSQADELRMSRDFLQPGTIGITMAVMDNRALPNMSSLSKWDDVPSLTDSLTATDVLAEEWRADEVRSQWGQLKPIKVCSRAGDVRRIYGRPRKFQAGKNTLKSEWVPVVADFQRADTLAYSDDEFGLTVAPSALGVSTGNLTRLGGRAPAWFKVFIIGPINLPKIRVGSMTVELDHNLAAGKVIELSSYPWERRVIDSDAFNLSPKMVGNSPYLDQLKLPPGSSLPIGLSGAGTTAATKATFLWREAYHTY